MTATATNIRSSLLTAAQAAKYLHFGSPHSFRQAVVVKQIPHRRHGRRLFFIQAELDVWLKRRTAALLKERTSALKRRRRKTAA